MLSSKVKEHKVLLENHSLLVTNTIQSIDDLRVFMEHHVFAVWDFMSLAKALQEHVCPSGVVWVPNRRIRSCGRFINEIILGEESDVDPNGGYISHFDLYCQAMLEIGADIKPVTKFLDMVTIHGIDYALDNASIPEPSRQFMKSTFDIIKRNKAHEIASAFSFGRESVIPDMFRRLVSQLDINNINAPRFIFYLDRHIEVDSEDHGPAALSLIQELCDYQPIKIIEAETAAVEAIRARIHFWDRVEEQL